MKYLYKNEEGVKVERQLGHTWYYCEVLKSAIKRYGLSDKPDFEELDKIIRRSDIYMKSGRYVGTLGAIIFCTSDYVSDLYLIRAAILKMDRNSMNKKQIQTFYKTQIKKINKATEDYKYYLWTS